MTVNVVFYSILAVSPFFFLGLVNRGKALWAGRRGAPVLQPYSDFSKLIRKGEVVSRTTSFVFRAAPTVQVAAVLFALLFVPVPYFGAVLSFPGDFVLFAYVLGLGKFLLILAALDTGSSFEGMGASREVTFSVLVEMAFFILLGTLALMTGQVSFGALFATANVSAGYSLLVKILLVVSLFLMLLAEGSRVPVDDPATHLELTMIHEVMILDYSGPDLAYLLYAAGLKMVLIALLIANLCVPAHLPVVVALPLVAGTLVVVFAVVAVIESLIARSRMSHVPQFLFLMTALSLTAFAVIAFFLREGI